MICLKINECIKTHVILYYWNIKMAIREYWLKHLSLLTRWNVIYLLVLTQSETWLCNGNSDRKGHLQLVIYVMFWQTLFRKLIQKFHSYNYYIRGALIGSLWTSSIYRQNVHEVYNIKTKWQTLNVISVFLCDEIYREMSTKLW